MSETILPCPNPECGVDDIAIGESRYGACAVCADCGYCGPTANNATDAIAAHNTVAAAVRDHAALTAERDALRAQVAQLREAFGSLLCAVPNAAAHENTPCDPRYGCVVCAAAAALAATAPDQEATNAPI